jgi:hypothetical protein
VLRFLQAAKGIADAAGKCSDMARNWRPSFFDLIINSAVPPNRDN